MPDNRVVMRRVAAALAAMAAVCGASPVPAAQVDPHDHYRIFLTDGESLPSYGAYALVADRIVFTLPVGGATRLPELQLMSLPISAVDLDRTSRYALSLRAARYAATRGEADYAAVTDEVSRAIEQLDTVEDPARRLALAEEAKRRLLAWSRENYFYRAADIRQLAGLFDEVIAELRVAAGEPGVSFDLRADVPDPAFEPLLDLPTPDESVSLALRAASTADIGEERIAILETTRAALADRAPSDPWRQSVERELDAERRAGAAYDALRADLIRRAEAALERGDVRAAETARATLADRDRALGARRPRVVQALRLRLALLLEATAAHRLALDRFAALRPARLAYERTIRPVTSGLSGVESVLIYIRDRRFMSFATVERAVAKLGPLAEALERVRPPDDLDDVHATLVSAMVMAQQAMARWRTAVITENTAVAAEASAAAAGSLLLTAQCRAVLVSRLYPPGPSGRSSPAR